MRPMTVRARHLAARYLPYARKLAWQAYAYYDGRVPQQEMESRAAVALCSAASYYHASLSRVGSFYPLARTAIFRKLADMVRKSDRRHHLWAQHLIESTEDKSKRAFWVADAKTPSPAKHAEVRDLINYTRKHLTARDNALLDDWYEGHTPASAGRKHKLTRQCVENRRRQLRKKLQLDLNLCKEAAT